MTRDVRHVLVVGAGAIGTSWAAHLLVHGLEVSLVDTNAHALEQASAQAATFVTEAAPERDSAPAMARLRVHTDLATAASTADLVIEAGPEKLPIKRALFARLDEACAPDVVLTSSSSGLPPSSFTDACVRHRERVLIAHPFNPPHLVPLVELVGAPTTSEESLEAAASFFTGIGKQVIRVRAELPGHVVNRLQAALWREAYDLVARGVVSVAEVDTAIAWGPGLRWALLGPFATQHLSGGPGGIAHVLDHLGPPMVEWWADLGSPELTPELCQRITAGITEEFDGVDVAQLRTRRDATLRALLAEKRAAHLP